MANKIKLAGTTSNNFQIGLQGVTIFSNRATSPYNLSLPANSGSASQVLVSDATGNLNWSNSAINAGTVTTNAQPNITSVGTLTSLSVSGNANVGNLGTTGLITATGNITGGNLLTDGNVAVGTTNPTANLHIQGNINSGVKLRVENQSTGNAAFSQMNVQAPEAGLFAYAYGNGYTNSGRFAAYSGLLDATGLGGLGLAASGNTANMRFYTNGSNIRLFIDTNGNVGIGNTAPTNNLSINGTLYASGNANVGNIGATNGVFTNISGNGAALTSITGANISGTVANATYATSAGSATTATTAGTVTTAAQPNITSVGTLSSLSVSGNANVGNIGATNGVFTNVSGNGAALTSITGANVTGTVANATYATSAGSATTAGTVTTNAQPNITSVGTLSSLSVSGNANIGNIGTAGILTVTGNANVGNIGATNGVFTNVSGNGASLTGILSTNITGTVSTANTVTDNAQPNITSVGTLSSLSVSGNANVGNISTAGKMYATGTSTSYGLTTGNTVGAFNATMGVGAAATWLLAGTSNGVFRYGIQGLDAGGDFRIYEGANLLRFYNNTFYVPGLSASGNAQVSGFLTVTGNITSTSSANYAQSIYANNSGTGNSAFATVGAFSDTVSLRIVAGGSNYNIQPNITGNVGLYSGTTSTPIYFWQNAAERLRIDASGNLVGTPTTAATSTTTGALQIAGGAGIAGNLYAGNLYTTGLLSVTGNANVGNIGANNGVFTTVSGTLSTAAQTSITSLGTLSSLSVSGNANVGNLGTAGRVTATGLSTSYGVTTGNGVGAFTALMGTASSATWLLSGMSNGEFRGGIQLLDAGGVMRLYEGANYMGFGSNNLTISGVLTAATVSATSGVSVSSTIALSSNIISFGAGLPGTGVGGTIRMTGSSNVTYIQSGIYSTSNSAAPLAFTTILNGREWMRLDENGNLGVNIAAPTSKLHVVGNANITGAVTFGNTISTTGNVDVANLTVSANGDILMSGSASQLTGANLVSANYVTGTLTTAAQPNITSVGTLTSLSVSGTITGGNLSTAGTLSVGTTATVTGTLTAGNLSTAGNSSVGGTSTVTGNLSTANIISTGLITTTGNITASGNVRGGNLISLGIISATGNISTAGIVSVTGNANVANLNADNVYTTGVVSAAGNVRGANLNTTGVVSATGTITGGNLATAGTLSAGGNANVGNLGTAALVLTGNITGDFSSIPGTVGRTHFITTTTNGNTNLAALPAGTGVGASFLAFNNSNTANAGYLSVAIDSSTVTIGSTRTGTATYLPLAFATSGTEAGRWDTGGNLLVGTTNANGANNITNNIMGGIHSSIKGVTASVLNATATTIFTLPTVGYSTWLVSLAVNASSNRPDLYNEVAVITTSGPNATVGTLINAPSSNITVSGLQVQATQTSAATQDVYWSAVRIM